MRYVVGMIVFIASFGAIFVTMAMNGSYQYGQGATPFEATMRLVAMVVFDSVKAGLPVGLAWWAARRQWLLLAIGAATFAFCFVMSVLSAVGFYASNHVAVSQNRDGVTVSYRDARRELDATTKRLTELGTIRPVAVVEASLQGLRTDKRFATSKECSEVTLPASRELCREYFSVQSELAAAREAARLQDKADGLQTTVRQLLRAGAERESDPQAAVIGKLLPFLGFEDVKLGVDILPSLLLEIVASFGLLLASSLMVRKQIDAVVGIGTKEAEPGEATVPVKPMAFKVRKDGMVVIEGC